MSDGAINTVERNTKRLPIYDKRPTLVEIFFLMAIEYVILNVFSLVIS